MEKRNRKITTLILAQVLLLAILFSGCKTQKVDQGGNSEIESTQSSTVSDQQGQTMDTQDETEHGLELIDGDENENQVGEGELDWAAGGDEEGPDFEESANGNTQQPKDPTKPTEPTSTTEPTTATEPTSTTESTTATEPASSTDPAPTTEPTQPGGSTDSGEWGPLI